MPQNTSSAIICNVCFCPNREWSGKSCAEREVCLYRKVKNNFCLQQFALFRQFHSQSFRNFYGFSGKMVAPKLFHSHHHQSCCCWIVISVVLLLNDTSRYQFIVLVFSGGYNKLLQTGQLTTM